MILSMGPYQTFPNLHRRVIHVHRKHRQKVRTEAASVRLANGV